MPKDFKRQVNLALTIVAVSALLLAASFFYCVKLIHRNSIEFISNVQDIVTTQDLALSLAKESGAFRGYLLTREPSLLGEAKLARENYFKASHLLYSYLAPGEKSLLDDIKIKEQGYHEAMDGEIQQMKKSGRVGTVALFITRISPKRETLVTAVSRYTTFKRDMLLEEEKNIKKFQNRMIYIAEGIGLLVVILSIFIVYLVNQILISRKQYLDTLQQRADELEKAVTARESFMLSASHELKTPLTSLKLQAQMRKRLLSKNELSYFTPEKIRKMVEEDEQGILRLAYLIDEMLDISRLNARQLKLNIEHVDLCILVQEVVERFMPQFEQSACAVSLEPTNPVLIWCDRYRVEQVISNLFTNAMKYAAGNEVYVGVTADDVRAKLIVRDQGMGVAKEDQMRIFQQFERASSNGAISGLGIGLYISKQIVQAHGGTISIESELGQGSTFTVNLPRNIDPKAVGGDPIWMVPSKNS